MDLTRQCPVVSRHLTAATQLKSQEVFAGMQERIKANVEKAKSVKGVFLWNITKGGKVEGQWSKPFSCFFETVMRILISGR